MTSKPRIIARLITYIVFFTAILLLLNLIISTIFVLNYFPYARTIILLLLALVIVLGGVAVACG